MSNFMCKPSLFAGLAQYAARNPAIDADRIETVRMFVEANAAATGGSVHSAAVDHIVRGALALDSIKATTIQLLKAVDCLMYQCSDWEHWDNSEAARMARLIKSALIDSLPGYNEAKWGEL